MKIKMLTTASGADPQFNFTEGEVRDVTVAEARYWDAAKVCTLLEPYPGDAEKPTLKTPEKAVVKPPETAIVGKKQGVTLEQLTKPAASDWGKK